MSFAKLYPLLLLPTTLVWLKWSFGKAVKSLHQIYLQDSRWILMICYKVIRASTVSKGVAEGAAIPVLLGGTAGLQAHWDSWLRTALQPYKQQELSWCVFRFESRWQKKKKRLVLETALNGLFLLYSASFHWCVPSEYHYLMSFGCIARRCVSANKNVICILFSFIYVNVNWCSCKSTSCCTTPRRMEVDLIN